MSIFCTLSVNIYVFSFKDSGKNSNMWLNIGPLTFSLNYHIYYFILIIFNRMNGFMKKNNRGQKIWFIPKKKKNHTSGPLLVPEFSPSLL